MANKDTGNAKLLHDNQNSVLLQRHALEIKNTNQASLRLSLPVDHWQNSKQSKPTDLLANPCQDILMLSRATEFVSYLFAPLA